jgi:hypothetical protein
MVKVAADGCKKWMICNESRKVVFVSDVECSRTANLVLASPSDFDLAEDPAGKRTSSEAWIRSEESHGCRSNELM